MSCLKVLGGFVAGLIGSISIVLFLTMMVSQCVAG
jgi:capsular polysaccharide biosynthesis protein